MFAVDDIDDVVARMRAHGAELIGEMQYGDTFRLAYIRGPEGIIVGMAEELGKAPPRTGRGRPDREPSRPVAKTPLAEAAGREEGGRPEEPGFGGAPVR
jgi:hypothetical protein